MIPADLATLDAAAFAWFVLAWLGYGAAGGALLTRVRTSVHARMLVLRRTWMHTMLGRENRMVDASLIGHTVHSATFFASTTMVLIAALSGILGNAERAYGAIRELAYGAATSWALFEIKLLLVALVFSHGFLKLTWALRQLNYCVALIGSAPLAPAPAQPDALASTLGDVLSRALMSFNAGIRGYYFALAALGWLLGPTVLLVATTGIVVMLLWRELGSPTAAAIRRQHEALLLDREG